MPTQTNSKINKKGFWAHRARLRGLDRTREVYEHAKKARDARSALAKPRGGGGGLGLKLAGAAAIGGAAYAYGRYSANKPKYDQDFEVDNATKKLDAIYDCSFSLQKYFPINLLHKFVRYIEITKPNLAKRAPTRTRVGDTVSILDVLESAYNLNKVDALSMLAVDLGYDNPALFSRVVPAILKISTKIRNDTEFEANLDKVAGNLLHGSLFKAMICAPVKQRCTSKYGIAKMLTFDDIRKNQQAVNDMAKAAGEFIASHFGRPLGRVFGFAGPKVEDFAAGVGRFLDDAKTKAHFDEIFNAAKQHHPNLTPEQLAALQEKIKTEMEQLIADAHDVGRDAAGTAYSGIMGRRSASFMGIGALGGGAIGWGIGQSPSAAEDQMNTNYYSPYRQGFPPANPTPNTNVDYLLGLDIKGLKSPRGMYVGPGGENMYGENPRYRR